MAIKIIGSDNLGLLRSISIHFRPMPRVCLDKVWNFLTPHDKIGSGRSSDIGLLSSTSTFRMFLVVRIDVVIKNKKEWLIHNYEDTS